MKWASNLQYPRPREEMSSRMIIPSHKQIIHLRLSTLFRPQSLVTTTEAPSSTCRYREVHGSWALDTHQTNTPNINLGYSYISNNWWSSTTAEKYFTFAKLLICSLTLFMAWTGNDFRSSSLQPYQGQLHFMTLSVPSPLSGEFLGVIFLPPSLSVFLSPSRSLSQEGLKKEGGAVGETLGCCVPIPVDK